MGRGRLTLKDTCKVATVTSSRAASASASTPPFPLLLGSLGGAQPPRLNLPFESLNHAPSAAASGVGGGRGPAEGV